MLDHSAFESFGRHETFILNFERHANGESRAENANSAFPLLLSSPSDSSISGLNSPHRHCIMDAIIFELQRRDIFHYRGGKRNIRFFYNIINITTDVDMVSIYLRMQNILGINLERGKSVYYFIQVE